MSLKLPFCKCFSNAFLYLSFLLSRYNLYFFTVPIFSSCPKAEREEYISCNCISPNLLSFFTPLLIYPLFKFKFTNERRDFSVKPPTKSVLNILSENAYAVISIGKVSDVFDGEGITKKIKARDNQEAINKLTDIMGKNFTGLCMANLSDFDSLYAHKRDLEGYARAIEELDVEIPMIINKLDMDDLLIITADHGCDPTFKGTFHTRENVPVIIYGRNLKEPKRLEILESMADIGATIAENFEVSRPLIGKSFLEQLK